VIHAGGTNVISADQRQNGGRWNLLGTFSFTPGANHRVVLTNSSDGAVIADAIKVVADNLAPSIGNIHTDHLGTPRLIEDQSGKTVWRWDHLDPFGANPANEDPDGDGVKVVFNLRFPGQVFDKETGMHYNYFRDYDPASGRYVQTDPIGLHGGNNLFAYVGNNPLELSDRFGLLPSGADPNCFSRGECKCATPECAAGLPPNKPFPNEICIKECMKARWPVCGITMGSGVPAVGPICTVGMLLICNAQCENPGPPNCQIGDIVAP
jgi:RHS repeat-associated protein